MLKCPVCASDRMVQRGESDGPMCCEDCGFRIGGKCALPNPLWVATSGAAQPPAAPRQGGLADWAMARKKRGARGSLPAAAGAAARAEGPRRTPIPVRTDYLYFPDRATMGQVLQTCQEQHSPGPTLLVTQVEGAYRICSVGSLLPYLAGQTPHIVHRLGQCPICSGLDPAVWQDTAPLLEQVLADAQVCARLLWHLPLAQIPVVEAQKLADEGIVAKLVGLGFRACAVTQNGVLCGVWMIQQEMALGGPPGF